MEMDMKDGIKVGMFGMGNVGVALFRLLNEKQSEFKECLGVSVQISKIVVANLNKDRGVDLSKVTVGTDLGLILDDPEIDVVLELIGGTDEAEKIILTAFANGKSVVTANKALLAEKAEVIFPAACKSNGNFGFEASVGAAIPIIRTFKEAYAGDEIQAFYGILNGTSNYVLSNMTERNLEFKDVLKEAQQLGLAEADPTLDIEGFDAAHKLTILMNIAFGGAFDFSQLHVEGISKITASDISYTGQLGFKIKHIGQAKRTEKGIEACVHPILLPKDHILSSVNGPFNAVALSCKYSGKSLLYGQGAGPDPSAAGVAGDLLEACRYALSNQKTLSSPIKGSLENWGPLDIVPVDQLVSEYYLRFSVLDHPGVLAAISKVLAEHSISIRSAIQKGAPVEGKPVDIVMTTHHSAEANVQSALNQINQLDFMVTDTQLLRIARNL